MAASGIDAVTFELPDTNRTSPLELSTVASWDGTLAKLLPRLIGLRR